MCDDDEARRARGCDEIRIGAWVAGDHEVERRARGVDELNQREARHPIEFLQVVDLERLDEHRVVPVAEAGCIEDPDQRLLERQPDALKIRRVFGLGIDADHTMTALAFTLCEGNHRLERRDLELAIERRVLGSRGAEALAGTQGCEISVCMYVFSWGGRSMTAGANVTGTHGRLATGQRQLCNVCRARTAFLERRRSSHASSI